MQAVPSVCNLRGAGTLGGAGGENDQENTARLCAEGPYTPSGSVGKSCTETCNQRGKFFAPKMISFPQWEGVAPLGSLCRLPP